jgi:uncharacterized RDD family membrane protein YckC
MSNIPPKQPNKATQTFEIWLKRMDELATLPRRRLLAKRAAEKENPYATFNDRSLAFTIDLAIIFTVLMPVLLPLSRMLYADAPNPLLSNDIRYMPFAQIWQTLWESGYIMSLLMDYIAHFLLFGALIFGCWSKYACTPGKWVMRMRIVDAATGRKPSTKKLVIRYCAYIVSALPLTVGFLWILADDKRRGWHDIIAGTTVNKVKGWKL